MSELTNKLTHALNSISAENASNTPDFILAEFLEECLRAWEKACKAREDWYGYKMRVGMPSQISRDEP